ncbi:MAG: FmdB family zinc ribbon protein [Vampirovibrionales bacterium]
MPQYLYRCHECGYLGNYDHGMYDEPVIDCPHCGAVLARDFKTKLGHASLPKLLKRGNPLSAEAMAEKSEEEACKHGGSCLCAWDFY